MRILILLFASHSICINVPGCIHMYIGTRIRTVAEAPKTNQKLGVEVSFRTTSHIQHTIYCSLHVHTPIT